MSRDPRNVHAVAGDCKMVAHRASLISRARVRSFAVSAADNWLAPKRKHTVRRPSLALKQCGCAGPRIWVGGRLAEGAMPRSNDRV